jgi:mitochondrial fission protein ELM1
MIRQVTWVLTTGEAGMRSQAVGLAEAVGLPIEEKRIVLRQPWSTLPGGLIPLPRFALHPSADRLDPPWPRLVVACGRRSIGPALMVKRLSRGRTIAAYVQNPKRGLRGFDLVAAMPHDRLTGENVVTVQTALHGVTPERLAAARGEWRQRLAPDGRAFIGVLVGGDNGGYRLSTEVTARLLRVLRSAHAAHGLRAVITSSRRTSAATREQIAAAADSEDWCAFWDETGDNPYLGILALAERLIVTGDSISMVSEALATGRPVHVLPLEGQSRRHDAFLDGMAENGLVSLIQAEDLDWRFAGGGAVYSTAEPAARLREMLARQAAG